MDFISTSGSLGVETKYGPQRIGEVKHSRADITKAKQMLACEPHIKVTEGLFLTMNWNKTKQNH